MLNESIRMAGRAVAQANLERRRKLARKFDLKVTDFMPKKISATLAEHPEISLSEVHRNLIPKTNGSATMAKKGARTTSIPLEAIPGKTSGRVYTLEFKKKVVAALGSKTMAEVCEEFGVGANTVSFWAKRLDPHAATRMALQAALRERESRLESAAMMVEVEGTRGAEIAMRIRDLIKPRGPTPSYRSAFAHRSELNRGKAGGIASAAKSKKK